MYTQTELLFARALCVPLTVGEAAETLGESWGHLYSRVRNGELKAYHRKKPGHQAKLLVPVWSIMSFQDACAAKIFREAIDAAR